LAPVAFFAQLVLDEAEAVPELRAGAIQTSATITGERLAYRHDNRPNAGRSRF
jgi:hypothetical protein